jgi:glycosyltransferase involved in cell wall biosynthesis
MATKKTQESARIEVRISVADTPREIVIESDASRDEIINYINEAMAANTPLVLSDFRGRQVVVPAGKIGFVEIAAPTERRVGFATL